MRLSLTTKLADSAYATATYSPQRDASKLRVENILNDKLCAVKAGQGLKMKGIAPPLQNVHTMCVERHVRIDECQVNHLVSGIIHAFIGSTNARKF